MLLLHRMGFNILFVNFRGSLGLGEENVRSLLGHVGDMDVKDCHHARQRCLDLYLCPRIKKKKLNIDPEALIPKLPDASTLRPFPTSLNLSFMGHNAAVISLATSP